MREVKDERLYCDCCRAEAKIVIQILIRENGEVYDQWYCLVCIAKGIKNTELEREG